YPKSSAAAGFQSVTRSSASMTITAAGLMATSDSRYWRCRSTSENRGAFWIATPTLAAIVASSRESASPNRLSSSMLWTLTTPIAESPTRIGTPRNERAGVPTVSTSSNCVARLENVEQSYPDTPSGLGIAVGWGQSYFHNYVPKVRGQAYPSYL